MIDPASKTTKQDRQLNAAEKRRQQKMLSKAEYLANKYYNTTDLKTLSPRQLDKVISWTTGIKAGIRKEKGRTYGRYIKGKL